jgi:pimeloyl-ACP methyl ester carboxylesterase
MSTHQISLHANDDLALTFSDTGTGRPVLLLHGGGGPRTVADFATRLATDADSQLRVITPVHPGFDGTPRSAGLSSPAGLAALYAELLEELELEDVLVVGNSIGGWIAAELALLAPSQVAGYVLVDAVGIEVQGHPVIDFFSLPLPAIAEYSYYAPDAFRIDPAALRPAAQQTLAANRVTLEAYAGREMLDPTLLGRLAAVQAPTLVAWGEADRIADPDYGRALAAAIPGARFELMLRTGHLPQMETPEQLSEVLRTFAADLL